MNTMKGMRGFIKTSQDKSSAGLEGEGKIEPKREGPIGKRGSSGSARMATGKLRGSSDKSYRATSTGPAGRVVSNKGLPSGRSSNEAEGPARGKPRTGAHQVSGAREFGHGKPKHSGSHPGTMESLKGKARTSWEK